MQGQARVLKPRVNGIILFLILPRRLHFMINLSKTMRLLFIFELNHLTSQISHNTTCIIRMKSFPFQRNIKISHLVLLRWMMNLRILTGIHVVRVLFFPVITFWVVFLLIKDCLICWTWFFPSLSIVDKAFHIASDIVKRIIKVGKKSTCVILWSSLLEDTDWDGC